MFSAVFRGFLALCFVVPGALPAWGAPRSLPQNAVITVRPFGFPAAVPEAAERHLPAALHDQIAYALQGAGFILFSAEPAAPPAAAGTKPLKERPLPSPAEKTAGAEEEVEETAEAGEEEMSTPFSPQAEPLSPLTEAEEDAPPAAPEYILSGRVTLLREYAGPPARVAGDLRTRFESAISLTYGIADPSSGRTLFSDAVSVSATRLVPENENPDAARSDLTGRAMAEAAAKIAVRLAVTEAEASGDDRDYYGDSPGKRLKPGK